MTIFKAEHKSDRQRDWKVEILDTDSSTFIGDFKLTSDGVSIKTNGKKREINQSIIGTTCKFTVYIENTDHENFVLSLGTSVEGRYSVKVYLDDTLEFTGIITTDTVNIENGPKPYTFELEANDGLKLIKGVEWRNEILTGGITSLHSILTDAFSQLPTYDLYGVGDDYVSYALNWWSEEHTSNSQNSGNVFEKTYTSARTFAKRDNDEVIYFDAYKTIEEIARAFNARVYQSKGRYIFEQIHLREADSVDYITYNKEGTGLSTPTINQVINIDRVDNFHMAGGTISILPQLKRADVFFAYDQNFNYLPAPTPFSNSRTPGFQNAGEYNLINGDNKLQCSLDIASELSGDLTDAPQRDIVWKFRLKIGDYYLDGNQANYEWVTDTDAYFIIGYGQLPILPFLQGPNGQPVTGNNSVEFTTPEIQESGTVEVDLFAEYWEALGGGSYTEHSSPPAGVTHNWSMDVSLLTPVEGADADSRITVQYTSSQDSGTRSTEVNTIIGDGLVANRPGVLSISLGIGQPKQITTGWRANNTGDYKKFGQLLAETILSLNLRNLRIYNAVIYAKTDHIRPENLIKYDGFDLIFNNSNLNSDKDEITLEGIEVGTNTTGITNTETDVIPVFDREGGIVGGGSDTTGDPETDPDDPVESDPEGLITSEPLYAGDVITEIPIVAAPGDFFGTGDVIIVQDRISGVEQQYTLTAPISENDTTVSIESATVANLTAIYSPIYLSPNFIAQNRYPKYQIFTNESGSDVTVTEFTLPDPTEWTVQEIRQRLHVYRQTAKIIYDVGFNIDISTNKITFAWNLSGEYVEVYFLQ